MTKEITEREYSDYFDSFVNAFELKRSDTPLSVQSENDDILCDYLTYGYDRLIPPMKKSMSWSSTDPTLAYERDCYLSPYACSDYKRISVTPRPRSVTLPANGSPNYLNITPLREYKRYGSVGRSSSFSSHSSAQLESIQERNSRRNTASISVSSEEELNVIMATRDLLQNQPDYQHQTDDECPQNVDNGDDNDDSDGRHSYTKRERAYTAPPAISITDEVWKESYPGIETDVIPAQCARNIRVEFSSQAVIIQDLDDGTMATTTMDEDDGNYDT